MAKWVDPAKERAEFLGAQVEYGKQIRSWLSRSLPDVAEHPAAMSAVIRLHYKYGKGSLTVAEHGPAIRAEVASFNERFGLDDDNEGAVTG